MRKLIMISAVLFAVLCMSCNNALQHIQGGHGTVTIAIGGGAAGRAIGSNGLPDLQTVKVTIRVTKTDGTLIKEETLGERTPKSLSVTLPVGEKITVTVRLDNASAKWEGSAVHTVTAGSNTVTVKLKKSAAALNTLLFRTSEHIPHHHYTLTFKIGATEIQAGYITNHSFCRDNKGRIWLAYSTGSVWKVERYTSEGNKEDISVDLPNNVEALYLASDQATGSVYAGIKISGEDTPNLYKFEENAADITCKQLSLPDSTALISIEKLAVHNNSAVIYSGRHGLVLYRINGTDVSHLVTYRHALVEGDTRITLGHGIGTARGEVQDLYMTGDALYVLFSSFGNSANDYYALGGVVKYSYNDTTITKKKVIGSNSTHATIPQQTSEGVPRIIKTGTDEFYGPVKVIGFDADNLYIADCGVTFEYKNERPRLTANKNRIATLNKADDRLRFEDTSEAQWRAEQPVWKKPQDNPLVFFNLDKTDEDKLDKLVLSNDVSGSNPVPVASGIALDNDHSRNIFYTFDRDNNLYLGTKEKLKKFTKSDGSYTEDTSFMGVQGSHAYQNPAYDIVTETVYAVGKTAFGTAALFKYNAAANAWADVNISVHRVHDVYTVYNETVYGMMPHFIIQKIGETDTIEVVFGNSGSIHWTPQDIFIADNICYVLLNRSNTTKGAIASFDVTKIDTLTENAHHKKIIPDSQIKELSVEGVTEFGNRKFTGYRDGKLYIAVDGIKRSIVEGAPKRENSNKTVSFDTAAKTFDSPVTAPNGITWFRGENEWHGTKMIVWKRQAPAPYSPLVNKQDYYQIENAGDVLPSVSLGTGRDVFCHDADGNFYIAANDGHNNKLYRYTLNDDGSYGSGVDRTISSDPSVIAVSAIAVSASSIPADEGKTILFYYQSPQVGDAHHKIQRIAWTTGDFASSASKGHMRLNDLDSDKSITAITANKDGIFVAVKTVNVTPTEKKYTIKVHKYAHQPLSGGSGMAVSTVPVVSETSIPTSDDEHIEENLNALYIQDGVLYALTTKQKGYVTQAGGSSDATAVFIGGKLLKIGNTASFGSPAAAEVLYQNEGFTSATSGQFAPYRFIAVKPKKLVIASDGYYGQGGSVAPDGNKNAVFTFDIGSWDNPARNTVSSGVIFSKELATSTGFSWE